MVYTVFLFVARKPGTSIASFIDHYENKHMPLLMSIFGDDKPLRHSRYYLKRAPGDSNMADNTDPPPLVFMGDVSAIDYDCITAFELEDEAHFMRFSQTFANSPLRSAVDEDEKAFLDQSKLRCVASEDRRLMAPQS
jgi:hypothetical protein